MGVAGSTSRTRSIPGAITQAWVGLETVRPNRCGEPEDETGPRWEPRQAVDLLAGTSLGLERLPVGDYCELDVKIGRMEDGGSPLGRDLALILEGTTAAGTPFAIHMHDEIELDVPDADSAISDRAAAIGALLQFDLTRWIASVDLDGLPLVDGVVRIDADRNSDLLETVERAVGDSASVFVDDDGDLEPDDE
jgi:hypothetical protein